MEKKKLLVVDDDTEVREFMKSFFEERGFDVRMAADGKEAVEEAEKMRPHLILLDVQMPVMDGTKALSLIKQTQPHVKVIMITGLDTQEKIEGAMRLGADHYITKPLRLDYLEKQVMNIISELMERE